MRQLLHRLVNSAFKPLGVRAVNTAWGPRGFAESFRKMRSQGIVPGLVVDVGASNGQWTRECMEVFPESEYFLVDPLEQNVGPLRELAAGRPNVRVWQGGLGPRDGTLDMHVQGDQSSFLPGGGGAGPGAQTRVVSVPVRTLDSFLGAPEMPVPPGLIKLDVQGYELEVLRGATRCLGSAQYALMEVSFRRLYEGIPLAHDVVAFMRDHGFRVYDICSYAQRPRDGELVQADFLFAKDRAKVFDYEGYA